MKRRSSSPSKSHRKTIMVVTGTRAEFGLLTSTLHAIGQEPTLRLQLVAAGAHLIANTDRDIEDAGFQIAARVPMQRVDRRSRIDDAGALGRGIAAMADLMGRFEPDVVMVLGDRIEALAAAAAASVAGVHVAHIHGGDRAQGIADEAMRHAITKLAHIHLPATAASARRIIRMGEPRDLVFNVGSPAVDGLKDITPIDAPPVLMVMHHPVGRADAVEQREMTTVLKAVAEVAPHINDRPAKRPAGRSGKPTDTHHADSPGPSDSEAPWVRLLWPNTDPGCTGIVNAIEQFMQTRRAGAPKVRFVHQTHLPREAFLCELAAAAVIVGNSSAGLIEAAVLKTPCVNVGQRQAGRDRPGNVISCQASASAIRDAIHRAVQLDRGKLRHPYGPGGTGQAIATLLAQMDLRDVPIYKRNTY